MGDENHSPNIDGVVRQHGFPYIIYLDLREAGLRETHTWGGLGGMQGRIVHWVDGAGAAV